MANLALYNTTLPELQEFLQRTTVVANQKFTVIFEQEIADIEISPIVTAKTLTDKNLETSSNLFHDFTQDEFLGAWKDRQDIADSTEYVKKLRHEQWG